VLKWKFKPRVRHLLNDDEFWNQTQTPILISVVRSLPGFGEHGGRIARAALSLGCYAAAKFLGRVRPLRGAYEFLSRAYDRVLDQLGQKVLRDCRDTPALRLMVSLSLTAVPIFVIQLALGKPRLLLAIAFYLSLYGLRFQRFVRMFSASHLEAHRRQGYFFGEMR